VEQLTTPTQGHNIPNWAVTSSEECLLHQVREATDKLRISIREDKEDKLLEQELWNS